MKQLPFLSWNNIFALIDYYHLTPEQSCLVFNVTPKKLSVATQLRSVGTFAPTYPFDFQVYQELMDSAIKQADIELLSLDSSVFDIPPPANELPVMASKKVKVKVPAKRGRQSNKIVTALLAIPSEPTCISQFAALHDVSIAVLRQSSRFTKQLSSEELSAIGKIQIKKDKVTKQLTIWREDVS